VDGQPDVIAGISLRERQLVLHDPLVSNPRVGHEPKVSRMGLAESCRRREPDEERRPLFGWLSTQTCRRATPRPP